MCCARSAPRRRAGRRVPVLAVLMTARHAGAAAPGEDDVPVYATPEHAARALGHAARYAAPPRHPPPAVGRREVSTPTRSGRDRQALADGGGWLGFEETRRALLRAYGVPPVRRRVAGSPHAAGRGGRSLGDEVALKAIVPGLLHKRDAGAVRLGLRGAPRSRAPRASCARPRGGRA